MTRKTSRVGTPINLEPNELEFLTDSRTDMCIVKIASLNEVIIVNKIVVLKLKGISASPVDTYGTIMITMTINGVDFIKKIDLVNNDLSVPEASIIGRFFFLKDNKILIVLSVGIDSNTRNKKIILNYYFIFAVYCSEVVVVVWPHNKTKTQ